MIFNSDELANILGVNVSTVKRWADSGKIDCVKTKGGHRKFHIQHLRTLIKSDSKLSSNINLSFLIHNDKKLITAIETKNFKKIISYTLKSLISDNIDDFNSITSSLIIKGFSYSFIFDNILNPVLIKIGELWSVGELSITEEHLATIRLKNFLSSINKDLKSTISSKNNLNAYCFTFSGDGHDIPLYMAETIFYQFDNISVYNLGASLPIHDFIKSSNINNPDIIFISIVYIEDKKRFENDVNVLLNYFKDKKIKIFFSGFQSQNLNIGIKNINYIKNFKELENYLA